MKARPFGIIGHRGSPTVEVENTLPSFARAVHRDEANGLELDVCVTRDHDLVVWHDADPSSLEARLRTAALEPYVRCRPRWPDDGRLRRPVRELTLADVRHHLGYAEKRSGEQVDAHIPSFAEVLAWATHQPSLDWMFVDMKIAAKDTDLVAVFLARLDELVARWRPSCTLVLESAVPAVIEELQRLGARYAMALDVQPHPGLVVSAGSASAVDVATRYGLAWATAQKPRAVTLFPFATHRRIVARDVRRLQRLEAASKPAPRLCAFTINEPDEMAALLGLGVHAMQTDRPDVLASWIREVDPAVSNRCRVGGADAGIFGPARVACAVLDPVP